MRDRIRKKHVAIIQEKDLKIGDLKLELANVKEEFEKFKESITPTMKPDELTPSLAPLDNLFPTGQTDF